MRNLFVAIRDALKSALSAIGDALTCAWDLTWLTARRAAALPFRLLEGVIGRGGAPGRGEKQAEADAKQSALAREETAEDKESMRDQLDALKLVARSVANGGVPVEADLNVLLPNVRKFALSLSPLEAAAIVQATPLTLARHLRGKKCLPGVPNYKDTVTREETTKEAPAVVVPRIEAIAPEVEAILKRKQQIRAAVKSASHPAERPHPRLVAVNA